MEAIILKKVPNMLSTKDNSYIEDIFNWNITAYKKIDNYIDLVKDKNLSNELKKIAKIHKTNCDSLVKYLERWCNNE